MKSLIIVEQEEGLLNRPSLATVKAAKEVTDHIDLLVFDPTKIEEIKKVNDVKSIYTFKQKIQKQEKRN